LNKRFLRSLLIKMQVPLDLKNLPLISWKAGLICALKPMCRTRFFVKYPVLHSY
jgi:hypothetical protein